MKPLLTCSATRLLSQLTARSPHPRVRCLCIQSQSQNALPHQAQRQRFSTSRPTSSSTASYPPPKAYAHLLSRRLISLTGPDAAHFLQGLITQNVFPAAPRTAPGFYAGILNAQGRVVCDVFIYVTSVATELAGNGASEDGGAFLVEVDAKEASRIAGLLKRYKLRSKVHVRLLDETEMSVWSVWDEAEGWTAHRGIPGSHTISPPAAVASSTQSSLLASASATPSRSSVRSHATLAPVSLPDTRAPGMGRRLLLPGTNPPDIDADAVTETEYRIRRYLRGVPEGQREILSGVALPQESCMDYMGGIDYRKGCYVGQELTIRTHHTGVVRKRILPVMLYEDREGAEVPQELAFRRGDVEAGMSGDMVPCDLEVAMVGKRARNPGKFLAAVGNVGLALCRLETMVGAQGAGPTGEDEVQGGGDEFRISWGDEGEARSLRVKAFVPSWHLGR